MAGKKKKKKGTKKKTKEKKEKIDPEDVRKQLRKFVKTYQEASKKHNCEPISSIVQKVSKLYKSEEDPTSYTFPIIVNEDCNIPRLTALLETLNNYPHYKSIAFWRANLGDDGCQMLANWIKPNNLLKSVELMDNRISTRGCTALARALQHNECLTTLVLDYNDIGDEGAQAIASGVIWNPTLQILSLKYCNIGEEGGISIGSEIIGKSQSLKELDLQGNPLGPAGIAAIGDGLKTAKKLEKINLADTSFGHDVIAIKALVAGMEENSTLKNVNLNLNTLCTEGAHLVLELLTKKKSIVKLKVYEKMEKAIFTKIIDQLKKNRGGKKKAKKKGGKKKKKK